MRHNHPLSTFNRLSREFDHLLGSLVEPHYASHKSHTTSRHYPAMKFNEAKDQYSIEVVAPGIEPENFNIQVNDNVLSVSNYDQDNTQDDAKRSSESAQNGSAFNGYHFARQVELPTDANAEAIDAEYKHGILYIHIPKKEEAKPKTINVKFN